MRFPAKGFSFVNSSSRPRRSGKAIEGHKVGDRVLVDLGGGNGYYVEIRKIDNTDDTGDTIRKF